jgi:hypothetical protein
LWRLCSVKTRSFGCHAALEFNFHAPPYSFAILFEVIRPSRKENHALLFSTLPLRSVWWRFRHCGHQNLISQARLSSLVRHFGFRQQRKIGLNSWLALAATTFPHVAWGGYLPASESCCQKRWEK